MKTIRILTSVVFLITGSCGTIASLSYTTPEGRTVSVGFQQRQQSDGKAVVLPSTRGLAK